MVQVLTGLGRPILSQKLGKLFGVDFSTGIGQITAIIPQSRFSQSPANLRPISVEEQLIGMRVRPPIVIVEFVRQPAGQREEKLGTHRPLKMERNAASRMAFQRVTRGYACRPDKIGSGGKSIGSKPAGRKSARFGCGWNPAQGAARFAVSHN